MNLKDIPFDYKSPDEISQDAFRDKMVKSIYTQAEETALAVIKKNKQKFDYDRKLDNILTSPTVGYPIMLLLLGIIFWITITGANYPSDLLSDLLFGIGAKLSVLLTNLGTPAWLHGILIQGMYQTLAWVVSVMLPPMAIFFPLFTLLEDLGYLPRVAFNLDRIFKACGAHGKQVLTMCMGFGCNAAGVTCCRIIDSPREKLIAILTNNFVPCNGRFPTLIAIALIFMGGMTAAGAGSVMATTVVIGLILFGMIITLLTSFILSKTLLRGEHSSFTLELPPFRKPQIVRVIIRSILDRTLFVLARAMVLAAPAGLVIWILANVHAGDLSILAHCANFFDPFAQIIGLDGFILMAFILALPANEIVLPILIMAYMATGSMLELDSLQDMGKLFTHHGWTWLTALCTMLFSLLHWPCGTTLLTIFKETKSAKWTFLSFLIPTCIAIVICFLVAQGIGALHIV